MNWRIVLVLFGAALSLPLLSEATYNPGIDQVIINAPQGTPPFIVSSTTVATNLSAEYVDNIPGDWFDKKSSCLPEKIEFTTASTTYVEVYKCSNCSGTIGRIDMNDQYSVATGYLKLTVDGIDGMEFDNSPTGIGGYAYTYYHPIGAVYKNSLSIWAKIASGGGLRGVVNICSYQQSKPNARTCRPHIAVLSTSSTSYTKVVQCSNCAGRIPEIVFGAQSTGDQTYANVTIDGRSTVINNQLTDTSYGPIAYFAPLYFNNNMSVTFRGTTGNYVAIDVNYCLWENT